MKEKLNLASRMLLGLIFTVFGLNGLVMLTSGAGFIPMPPPSAEMGAFFGALMASKYLMPLVKVLEVLAGLMLLSGKYVKLALVLLAPIIVNILGIHIFIDLAGLPMSLLISFLLCHQICQHWDVFKQLLSAD